MAIDNADGLQPAKGATDKNAGPVSTPAPTGEQLRSTSYGRGKYGANAYGGPSSADPGKTITSGFDVGGNDDVMKRIQSQGLRSDAAAPVADQLRKVGDRNVPDATGMASARSRQASSHSGDAAKVPDRLGSVTRPGAPRP